MVTLQILVLTFQVRILVAQLKRWNGNGCSTAFFVSRCQDFIWISTGGMAARTDVPGGVIRRKNRQRGMESLFLGCIYIFLG